MNLNAKNKKIFFIIGGAGLGKTTLAELLNKIITGKVLIYDDIPCFTMKNKPKVNMIQKRIENCKYTGNKTIITTFRNPHIEYSPFLNKNVVWIILQNALELKDDYHIPECYHEYLEKSWIDYIEKRRTTRPCLIISRNEKEPRLEYNMAVFSKENGLMEI